MGLEKAKRKLKLEKIFEGAHSVAATEYRQRRLSCGGESSGFLQSLVHFWELEEHLRNNDHPDLFKERDQDGPVRGWTRITYTTR